MGKQSAPPPPDLTPISDAQIQIAQQQYQLAQKYMGLSQQQFDFMKQNAGQELDFAKQQADKAFGLQQQALDTQKGIEAAAQKVSDAQLNAMQQSQQWATEDRARYKSEFEPLQDQMVQYAKDYASPTRMSQNAAMAMGDVNTQFAQARANADQRLRSMGVDPSQVQSASLLNQMGVANAANAAQVGNNARIQTQLQGQALMGNAVNMGAGLPSQALGAMGQGTASGNSAVGAAGAGQAGALGAMGAAINYGGAGLNQLSGALNTYGSLTGSPMQWANFGSNLMNNANSTYGSAANTQMAQFNAGLNAASLNNQASASEFSSVMGAAGMAMMMAGGGDVPAVYGPSEGPGRIDQSDLAIGPEALKPVTDSGVPAKMGALSHVNTSGFDWKGAGQALFAASQNMKGNAPNYQTFNDQVPVMPATQADMNDGAIQYTPTNMSVPTQYRAQGGAINLAPQAVPRTAPFGAPAPQPAGARAMAMAPHGPVPMEQSVDKVHVMLTPGEYVVPKDVVHSKGTEFFDKLVKKYHRPGA